MIVSIAQLNFAVGDIRGNTAKILQSIAAARASCADVVVFPELAITGYPPEDLLFRPAFLRRATDALDEIVSHTIGIGALVGHPTSQAGSLFNSLSCLRDGRIEATYHKKCLPNYGVFDERRYFSAGTETTTVMLGSTPAALCVCEDLWSPEPARDARDAGAKILLSANASPFRRGVLQQRDEVLRQRARETGLGIIYVNLVGGQDELVFDGGSMVVDRTGQLTFQAPQFCEGQYLIELADDADEPRLTPKTYVFDRLPDIEAIYECLVLGVRDYVRKNGFDSVLVGLSGGIDSALVTIIAVDALGASNVTVLLMPSRYSSEFSTTDAVEMATKLGVEHRVLPIERPFDAFTDVLGPLFDGLPVDTTEESIQARCRGVLLMAVSNKTGKLVLTTSNKSEMAVGAAAIYGDMAGGFAPLKDVPKTLVYELARWRNCQGQPIPQRMIDRPPSAELRPNQLDSDSRPPYDVLDPIIEMCVERDRSPAEIVADGFPEEAVYAVFSKIKRNEFKRRQAAPGIKITQRAFGRERRYPIASGFDESTFEDGGNSKVS